MTLKEKRVLEYLVLHQGITETQAMISLGIFPSKLKMIVNNLQRKGLFITGDRNFVDLTYHLTKYSC
jgi:hypothetical protein